MSNLGPVYEDDENYSPSRQNAKGITRDTGTALVALASTKQLGLVIPTDTSAGLVKNVCYYVSYDGNFNRLAFEPIFHTHTHGPFSSHEDGGRLIDIYAENLLEFIEVNWITHQSAPGDFWNVQTSGGGAITLQQASGDSYHQIDTLTTTNNSITATMGGARLQFDDIIRVLFQTDLNRNTNLLARTGLNIDRVQDAPSTSRRQMGIEGCDGHGTNWVMLNANGNSASLVITPSTAPLNAGGDNTYQLKHYPADKCVLSYNGTDMATSTTNIADDGVSERQRLFRWGVKLTAGSLNLTQQLHYLRMIGNQNVFP